MNGFSGVASVGWLIVSGNPVLMNLDGLSNLASSGALVVRDNPVLMNLDGLSNLASSGALDISYNPVLMNLDGLSNLASAGASNVVIANNPSLCQSLVDAFVAACTSCGPIEDVSGNDDGC